MLIYKKLILIIISLAFALCLIEVGLRLFGYNPLRELKDGEQPIVRPSSAPHLQYQLTPNSAAYAWGTNVKVNSAGFRDKSPETQIFE